MCVFRVLCVGIVSLDTQNTPNTQNTQKFFSRFCVSDCVSKNLGMKKSRGMIPGWMVFYSASVAAVSLSRMEIIRSCAFNRVVI